jgi:hypothetical protein
MVVLTDPKTPPPDIAALEANAGLPGGLLTQPRQSTGSSSTLDQFAAQGVNLSSPRWDTSPQAFYMWSDTELANFRKMAIEAGLVDKNPSITQLYQAWQDLTQHSQSYQRAGQNLSPWDLLSSQVDTATPTGQEPFTGTKSRTDKTTQKVDMHAAEAAVREQVKQMIGRNPSKSQLTRLTGAFRNYFQQHPETTRTRTTYDQGDVTATDTQTLQPGGTAEGALDQIKNRVEGTDAYGVYQATGFYGNLLFDLLGQL